MHSELARGAVLEPAPRRRSRRALVLTWLRKVHLYVGLWGALLGLLFGATGILLNHRSILKIPVAKTVQRSAQVALPGPPPATPALLSTWLQQELKFAPVAPPLIKTQAAGKVVWAGRELWQPERWTVSLNRPEGAVNAEYTVGNRFVKVDLVDATVIGVLTRLHMSVGVNAFWVVLADTVAGSLILLSITGLLLWTQLHTVRTVAVFATCAGLVWAGLFLGLS